MKVNHHSLAYKMQAQPNKTYKDLRQKQKARIAEWMFQSACEYYKAHGEMPEGEAAEQITSRIYDKIKSLAIWVHYDEVHRVFLTRPCLKNKGCTKGQVYVNYSYGNKTI